MKTLKDFTPDIQARIPEYIERALEGVSDGERYNNFSLEKAIECVKWNYEKCGYKMPLVLVAENPLEMNLLFNYAKLLLSSNEATNRIDDNLRSQLRSQLDSQLRETNDKLFEYNSSYLFTINFYSDAYYTWYEFIRKEFNIELSINYDFQECFKLQRESGICQAIFSEGICVVSKYPKKVHWNRNNLMSNTEGAAVEWSKFSDETSFECHYVNGIFVPSNLFQKTISKELSVEEFFRIENEEHKSAIIALKQEKFGDTYLFDFLKESMTEVDSFVDKKNSEFLKGTTNGMNVGVYTLFKGEINDVDVAYVRCYCPSTDRMFFLGVEPLHSRAKDAIASLYRVPRKLKPHIKHISRQGERFSTVFDEIGTKMLKNKSLSIEDIQDSVSITGDEYFNFMRYEY